MPDTTPSPHSENPEKGSLALFLQNALLSLGAALLSIAIQGFTYGVHNNYYHLPIVFSLLDDPNFKADAYIQSLHFYASEFWLLARPLITEFNAPYVFFLFHIGSRWIFMASMLACARLLGVADLRSRLFFSVMTGLTGMVTGYSVAGGHGMLIDYFAHSEVANGVALFCLYYLASGRLATACAINGIVFSINAFMGVWNAVPFALCLGWRLLRKEITLSWTLRRLAVGMPLFLVIAAPAIFWIFQAEQAARTAPAFDYVEYLRFYWPFHFLFDENPLSQKIRLALLFVYALAGCLSVGKKGSSWVVILAGYALIYVTGIFVPHFTHSVAILNLHLLRVSSMIQMLACMVMISLAAVWLNSRDTLERGLFGPIAALVTCTSSFLEPLFLAALAVRAAERRMDIGWLRRLFPWKAGTVAQVAAAIVIALAIPRHVERNYSKDAGDKKLTADWLAMADWARYNTPTASVFLLPVSNSAIEMKYESYYLTIPKWYIPAFPFEAFSHRPAWVTFKEGAAVMWMPSFYPQWNQRIHETLALKTDAERIAYAQSHHIDYVVVEATSPAVAMPGVESVYQNKVLRVLKVSSPPSPAS